MRPALLHLRDLGGAYLALGTAFALVLARLLAASGGAAPPAMPGEVQNYVLFTTVTAGPLAVTTGSRFASTAGRQITAQWCYLERPGDPALRHVKLSLADADPAGRVTRRTLSGAALAALGLSEAEAAALAASHCRFLTGD